MVETNVETRSGLGTLCSSGDPVRSCVQHVHQLVVCTTRYHVHVSGYMMSTAPAILARVHKVNFARKTCPV